MGEEMRAAHHLAEAHRKPERIPRLPNERAYPVTTPDCIRPMATAFPVMTYTGRNLPAAVAYKGNDYRTFIMSFPFESIREEAGRTAVMASILHFFSTGNAGVHRE